VTEHVGIARNTVRRVETGDVGVGMQAKLGTPTPAFDLNPDPDPGPCGAARDQHRGASDPSDEVVALLLYFESSGLTNGQARSVLREVADAETAASTEL
jgi:hypothetical protein